ncbi:MAG: V-type ATP synthase subunit E [Lachnospiraceae bacterium]|nr:V-type ATP synthase subunit E [Lachnospiraceae bacterium]
MTGLEKIIGNIKAESGAAVSKIENEAKQRADQIRSEIMSEAQKEADRIKANAAAASGDAKERADSAVALERKRAMLKAKQEIIADTISAAKEKIIGFDTDKYFDSILTLIKNNARAEEGEIAFNAKDLSRMPSGFESKIAGVLPTGGKLKLSKEACDIDGGFVLNYDGTIENCSLSALFEAANEELCDLVREILFK